MLLGFVIEVSNYCIIYKPIVYICIYIIYIYINIYGLKKHISKVNYVCSFNPYTSSHTFIVGICLNL